MNRRAGGPSTGHVPMSSTSPSLCSPSSNNSSFASIKFERRSFFSPLSENFRSLIDSSKYDCSCRIDSQQIVPIRDRACSERTRNSTKPSRASLIFPKGAHSKIHPGQRILVNSPVPTIAMECLKLRQCPGGTSSSLQPVRRPKAAAEIIMRAA